jgi:predicted Co/Zn/Cd cation transporter (cation efflux family)
MKKSAKRNLIKSNQPKSVSVAVTLLSIALGLFAGRFLFFFDGFIYSNAVVVSIVSFSLTLFLIMMINKRKNWARIAYSLIFLAGILIYIFSLPFSYRYTMDISADILELVLQLSALVLLFNKSSSKWFSHPDACSL